MSVDESGADYGPRGLEICDETTACGTILTVTLNVAPKLRTLTMSQLLSSVLNNHPGRPQISQTPAMIAAERITLIGKSLPEENSTY